METKENSITIEEVLKITVENLKGIQIPVTLSESVGMRIAGSISNIQLCINAIEEGKQKELKVTDDEREDDPE